MRTGGRRRRAAAALLAVTVVALPSCSRTSSTGARGYVSGDGSIAFVRPADREAGPELAGATLGGGRLEPSDLRGRTVVVNVWGSWCAACREEAPALSAVARRYADRDVRFVGIAIRENESAATAFADRADVPYPSLFDPSSRTVLGFAGSLPSQAVPTTWILDDRGRVAARVINEVSAATLAGLIGDVRSGRPS